MAKLSLIEDTDYLVFPKGEPIAQSFWVNGDNIFNSLKLNPPYLLIVKALSPGVDWETTREWNTYFYHDLEKALEFINKKGEDEHRLYLLNNSGEESELSLIECIGRANTDGGIEELVFIGDNLDKLLTCPAPGKPLGKERAGGGIYNKAYPPVHNFLPIS